MRRAAILAGLGGLFPLADLVARPWRAHVTVVTGTAVDPTSWVIGPFVIVLHLLAVLAPILLLAALADVVLLFRPRRV